MSICGKQVAVNHGPFDCILLANYFLRLQRLTVFPRVTKVLSEGPSLGIVASFTCLEMYFYDVIISEFEGVEKPRKDTLRHHLYFENND